MRINVYSQELWLPKSSNRRQALANMLYELSQLVEGTF